MGHASCRETLRDRRRWICAAGVKVRTQGPPALHTSSRTARESRAVGRTSLHVYSSHAGTASALGFLRHLRMLLFQNCTFASQQPGGRWVWQLHSDRQPRRRADESGASPTSSTFNGGNPPWRPSSRAAHGSRTAGSPAHGLGRPGSGSVSPCTSPERTSTSTPDSCKHTTVCRKTRKSMVAAALGQALHPCIHHLQSSTNTQP